MRRAVFEADELGIKCFESNIIFRLPSGSNDLHDHFPVQKPSEFVDKCCYKPFQSDFSLFDKICVMKTLVFWKSCMSVHLIGTLIKIIADAALDIEGSYKFTVNVRYLPWNRQTDVKGNNELKYCLDSERGGNMKQAK